ncbi:chromosomal replication initiator protein DnaA, partial [Candidatus Saccharibacteria bacterium]|nr:chromosomal replication initiator protein DnaA [Candidatus Saccharibacteria bacterium]
MEHSLWQTVLGEIELSVSRAAYMTWFKKTELLEKTPDGELTVAVPNIFAKQQFEVKFDKQIRTILKKNGVSVKEISYTINSPGRQKKDITKTLPAKKIVSAGK